MVDFAQQHMRSGSVSGEEEASAVVCLLTATGVLVLVDNGLPNPDRGTAWLT